MMKLSPFSKKNKEAMGMADNPANDANQYIPVIMAAERDRPGEDNDVQSVNDVLQTIISLENTPFLVTSDRALDQANTIAESESQRLFVPHFIVPIVELTTSILGGGYDDYRDIYEQGNERLIKNTLDSDYFTGRAIVIILANPFGHNEAVLHLARLAITSGFKVFSINGQHANSWI